MIILMKSPKAQIQMRSIISLYERDPCVAPPEKSRLSCPGLKTQISLGYSFNQTAMSINEG